VGDILTRTLKNGRVAYYARYVELDGKRTARATKSRSYEDAQKVLWALEERVRKGQVGLAVPTKEDRVKREDEQRKQRLTIRELGEKFCAEYTTPKLKDPADYRKEALSIWKVRINPILGDIRVGALTVGDVERMRDRLVAPPYSIAPASASLTCTKLSTAYTWARKKGYITCAYPADGIDLPRAQASIDYLSKKEVASLLDYCERVKPAAWCMIIAAIYTGMRKGELFGLRWSDVHLDAARIDVMRSYKLLPKSGKVRHLPMHPELVRVLRGWEKECPPSGENLVFPIQGRMGKRDKTRGIHGVLKRAGCHVPKKAWHSLRHSFASHFMMAGGNILTLQKMLGHASVTMTMIYAHLAPDFMANEVARMTFAMPPAGVADMGEERRKRAMDTQRKTGADEADTATG
jgi:integrase